VATTLRSTSGIVVSGRGCVIRGRAILRRAAERSRRGRCAVAIL
jgi:hypothetical protein